MPCPICDEKPINCQCTKAERRMYYEIEELGEKVPRWIPVSELQWQPEQTVLIDVWLIDAMGQQHTDSVTFVAPIPVEPVPPPDPLPDPGGNDSIPMNVSL